jgi:hypothetical protein
MKIWRTIPGHPDYEVNTIGGFRKKGKTEITFNVADNSYVMVRVGATIECLHRLVAQAWLPIPVGYVTTTSLEVNHIDGNKHNNTITNLEWLTHAENMQHAKETSLMSHGENHHKAVLTDSLVEQIKREYVQDNTSPRVMAKRYGIPVQPTFEVCWGVSWTHILPELNDQLKSMKATKKSPLSIDQVEEIKTSLASGISGKNLALAYDVSRASITMIKNGKRHADVLPHLNQFLVGDLRYGQTTVTK